MSAPLSDANREIVPRWRDVKNTILLGELSPAHADESLIVPPPGLLEDKIHDWKSEQSLAYAEEVVGAAFVLGEVAMAADAAAYVIAHSEDASELAVNLARRVLHTEPDELQLPRTDRALLSASVRELKTLARMDPRNAFA